MKESVPAVPESVPAVPESVPVVPESVPAVPESVPVVPESVPAVPESTPAVHESPIFIEAGHETLFGVLSHPEGASNGVGVILLSGGDDIPSTNRNRVSVRIARRLAAIGYQVLRLDYRGVGESTGTDNGYSLDVLAVEDLDAAIAWFEGEGVSDLVLAGSCFGARTCLARAQSVPGLRGLVLISSPVVRSNPMYATDMPLGLFVRRMRPRKPLRGLLRFDKPRVRAESWRIVRTGLALARSQAVARLRPSAATQWASGDFVDSVVALPERGVALLMIYGDAEHDYREFMDAMGDRIDELTDKEGELIRLSVLPGEVHAFADLGLQQAVENETVSFLAALHERSLVPLR